MVRPSGPAAGEIFKGGVPISLMFTVVYKYHSHQIQASNSNTKDFGYCRQEGGGEEGGGKTGRRILFMI